MAFIIDDVINGFINGMNQENHDNRQRRFDEDARIWQTAENAAARQWQHDETQLARQWSENMTRESWARDDSALQRRVLDSQLAGLSPLTAAGSSPAQSSVVSSAPNGTSAPNQSPTLSYLAQPALFQMDLSGLVGAIMDSNKINLDKERLSEDKRASRVKEKIAMAEVQSNYDIAKAKLLQEGTQFEEMREQENDHFLKTYAQNAEQFSANYAQQAMFHYDDLSDKEKQRQFEDIQSRNKLNYEMAKAFGESTGIPVVYYPVTSVDDFNRGIMEGSRYLSAGNRRVLTNWKDGKFKSSEQSSQQSSLSGSAGVAGVGSAGVSSSTGASVGENRDYVAKEAIKGAYLENGVLRVPILVRDYAQWEKEYSHYNKKDNKSDNVNKNKKSDNAPNRTIIEFNPSGQDNVYNPFVRSKVWNKK